MRMINFKSLNTRNMMFASGLGLSLILAGLVSAGPVQTEDIYISASGSGTAGGVPYADEDILRCDRSGGAGTCIWELYFDGSEAGISQPSDLTAFHLLDDGNILMAFKTPKRIGNLRGVDDSDIVLYDPTADPASAFSFYFIGADAGLTSGGEDIDAMGFTPTGGGRLVISTDGDYSVPKTGGGTLEGGDGDLIVFNGTTGPSGTVGDWELYFDGSDVGLNTPQEDIWGAWIDSHTDEVYITTRGYYTVGSLSGTGREIFVCDPQDQDPISGCATVTGFFDSRAEDFKGKYVDGLFIFNNGPPEITSDGGGATAAVNVDENTTPVTDVQSADDNDAEGAGLTYSLTGGADAAQFSLDPNTGILSFQSAPDFENPADANADNDFEVQVTVTDSGGLTDAQDITVTVVNVNDGPPEITSNGGGATAAIDVVENTTGVTDVESTDPDDAEGSGLTYGLTGGADMTAFSIDPGTGVLVFAAAPDFENPADVNTDNDYEVQVTVTDSGPGVPLTDVQDIVVTVTNVNELPVITSDGGGATAAVSIDENTTAVTDVQTTDAEDSEGAGLAYSKTGGSDAALFSLDPVTGVLSFTAAPDFENPGDANRDNDYEVQVTVSDSGPGGSLTDSQDITVTVLDVVVENLPPTIVSTATPSAPENQTAAIDVQATDDRDAEGAGLTFSLTTDAGGGADNAQFSLDANNGVLTFKVAPDFENPTDVGGVPGDNDYLVQVTVTDSGPGGNLTTVQDLTVTVTNVNEAPTAADQSYNATGNVPIDVPAGSGLLVGSNDPDGDTLTVDSVSNVSAGAIVSANPDGSFTYTPPAGFTGTDSFQYTLIDNGSGTLPSNTATVEVTVADMIWFVDAANAACTPSCDGRLNSPFSDLAVTADSFDVNAPDAAGDNIFLADGSYNGGLTLLGNQKLIGEGSSSDLESITGITLAPQSVPLPVFSGTDPVITSAGNGIVLASNNTIRGMSISDTSGVGLSGTSVGTVTVSETSMLGNGGALDISGGTLAMAFDTVSSTVTGAKGVRLVSVTGTLEISDGTLNTTGATAVEIRGTGGGVDMNVTFQSVSSSGSTSGIVLDSTGSLPGSFFSVTGTGGDCMAAAVNCSGGTITGTSGVGVDVDNAQDVRLAGMQITSSGSHGIALDNVSGFSFDNSRLTDNGDAVSEQGLRARELSGAVIITDSHFQGNAENHIEVVNQTTAITSVVTVTGNLFDVTTAGVMGNNGISYASRTGPAKNVTFDIRENTIRNIRSTAIQLDAEASATHNITIGGPGFTDGNVFDNNNVALNLTNNFSGAVTAVIENNTMTNHGSSGAGQVINLFTSSSATAGSTFNATVRSNVIGTSGVSDSGTPNGNAVRIISQGNTIVNALLDSNTVHGVTNGGIDAQARDGVATLNLTMRNNTLNFEDSIGVFVSGTGDAAGEAITLCADIGGPATGNVIANTELTPFFVFSGVAVQQSEAGGGTASFTLPNFPGGTPAAVETFIDGQNTISTPLAASAQNVFASGTFTAGATQCTLPLSRTGGGITAKTVKQ